MESVTAGFVHPLNQDSDNVRDTNNRLWLSVQNELAEALSNFFQNTEYFQYTSELYLKCLGWPIGASIPHKTLRYLFCKADLKSDLKSIFKTACWYIFLDKHRSDPHYTISDYIRHLNGFLIDSEGYLPTSVSSAARAHPYNSQVIPYTVWYHLGARPKSNPVSFSTLSPHATPFVPAAYSRRVSREKRTHS